MESAIVILSLLLVGALASARHYRQRAEAWEGWARLYNEREKQRENHGHYDKGAA